MEHLNDYALARLVDEEPTDAEEAHLEECPRCRDELRAYREQTEVMAGLPVLLPPPGDWERLADRLRAEGLIRAPGVRRGPFWTRTPFQAAAAVVLFLGGALLGTLAPRGPVGGAGGSGSDASSTARLVAEASTQEEAARAVLAAEREYFDALVAYRRLARESGGDDGFADPAARYAALEAVSEAAQAGIREAPADPFLNGLLVSTAAERQAALDEMAAASGNEWF